LGLVWDPSSDQLLFNFSQLPTNQRPTKRVALSTIAKFYDPLGLITQIITKSKIFLKSLFVSNRIAKIQEMTKDMTWHHVPTNLNPADVVWSANVDWDDALPEPILSSWGELTSQLSVVQNLKFPRFVLQPRASVELHGFCDASMSAYGACLYLRSETNGESKVHLLCAKSRVAP